MVITVLTPTYNRAYSLNRLFQSLVNQSVKDFEWIIVDDGSTDNTESLVRKYFLTNDFPIRYYKKNNGGKHTALNTGVEFANGDYVFIVDSDDFLTVDSIEKIIFYVNQIDLNAAFCGVSGNKVYENGSKVGGEVDYKVIDIDSVSFREKLKIRGDMAEVWRRSVLLEYKFPVFENERFLSEGAVWSEIARKYKLRYINEPVYVCEYLEDGLTKNVFKCFHGSPKGTMLVYSRYMKDSRFRLITRIKSAIHYWQYTCDFDGIRPRDLKPVWWAYIFWPLGWFLNRKGVGSLSR